MISPIGSDLGTIWALVGVGVWDGGGVASAAAFELCWVLLLFGGVGIVADGVELC